ncbi:MAG: ABC transporter permease [Acidobacteria bacterium]|nr:ABC transporter permease [Acidobacteriota bacterium]
MSVAALPGVLAPEPGSAAAAAFFRSHSTWRLVVDDRFFETMRIPFLRGRTFGPGDSTGSQQVAVVNNALARQLFGSDDAVGKRFKLSLREDAPLLEVIGVCADAKYTSMRREFPPTVYMSYRQQDLESMTFALKTAGDPLEIVPSVRAAMGEIAPDVPLVQIQSQEGQIQRSMRQERLFAKLATVLGLVTLLLSGIGLYGLLAYSIATLAVAAARRARSAQAPRRARSPR